MKILPYALATAVILMALSSGVAAAENQAPHVEAQPFPSITLNVTGGVFYNLTYMGLMLTTSNGTYTSSFNQGTWNFTAGGNGTYSYANVVKFHPDNAQGAFGVSVDPLVTAIMKGNNGSHGNGGGNGNSGGNGNNGSSGNGKNSSNGNPPQNSTQGSQGRGPPGGMPNNSMEANVVINLKALNYSLSGMSVSNSSAKPENYSFPQYSMLEITISVTFQSPVQGPGNLQLIQLIKSSNESNGINGYYFGKIAHDHSAGVGENSHGVNMANRYGNSGNASVNMLYWWNNTFEMNGVSQNLTSTVAQQNGGLFITFNFSFNNTTSLKSVYQDPYIGIPGMPIFKNPIVKKIVGPIVNYVIVNAEYMIIGITSGLILVGGTTYTIYRKHRF